MDYDERARRYPEEREWISKFYFVVVLRRKSGSDRYTLTVSENRPTMLRDDAGNSVERGGFRVPRSQWRVPRTCSFRARNKTEAITIAEARLQQIKKWSGLSMAPVTRIYYEGSSRGSW